MGLHAGEHRAEHRWRWTFRGPEQPGHPGRERRDGQVEDRGVAAAVDRGSGADDVAAGGAGVDEPAEPTGGVAQRRPIGRGEVEVLSAACGPDGVRPVSYT